MRGAIPHHLFKFKSVDSENVMTPEQRRVWDKIELNCNWPPLPHQPYVRLYDPAFLLAVTKTSQQALNAQLPIRLCSSVG
jgi:hypothetical protein